MIRQREAPDVIAWMRRLHYLGHSYQRIAEILESEGVYTRSGRKWRPWKIRAVLELSADDKRQHPNT